MTDNKTAEETKSGALATLEPVRIDGQALPPVLAGRSTPAVQRKVERFYLSVPEIFEAWVTRRESPHTRVVERC